MEIVAVSKYLRVSPRKVKLVADSLAEKSIEEAVNLLKLMRKSAAVPILKTIESAVANAENNHNLKKENLSLKSIQVSKGSTFKRWRAVSRGRAHPYSKKTSHLKVILESLEDKDSGGKNGTKD